MYESISGIPAHKEDCDYFADQYVKLKYGQVKGGYFAIAKKADGVVISQEEAEPSQKWHMIDSYYKKKIDNGFDMQTPASLGRIMCPQLMLWIAEVAGLKSRILEQAMLGAIKYEDKNGPVKCSELKRAVLKEALHWGTITQIIKEASCWDDVVIKVSNIEMENDFLRCKNGE